MRGDEVDPVGGFGTERENKQQRQQPDTEVGDFHPHASYKGGVSPHVFRTSAGDSKTAPLIKRQKSFLLT